MSVLDRIHNISINAIAAIMSMSLDLKDLVEMCSIGTLLAYTMVTLSILILRYREENVGIVIEESSGNACENEGKQIYILITDIIVYV